MGPSDTLTFRGYGNEEESTKEPEKEQPEIEGEKRVSTVSLKSNVKCFQKRVRQCQILLLGQIK